MDTVHTKTRKGYWIECYTCGCSSQAHTKKELLGYCGQHGHDVSARYYIRAQMPDDEEEG